MSVELAGEANLSGLIFTEPLPMKGRSFLELLTMEDLPGRTYTYYTH